MAAEKVHLTKEKATLLATLYGRALDARSPEPILGDDMAVQAIERIDHDFTETGITRRSAASVAFRARFMDEWATGFLAAHPDAVVLHLGCGLDTRVHRLDPPPTVDWYDVDYPDVVELRRRLFPQRPGYTMIGSSVTDLAWLDQVPGDGRQVLVIAEGLFYYLDEAGGRELVRRIVDRFAGGQLVFDALSRLGLRLQVLNTPVRRAKARMHWAVDGPEHLLSIHPKLRCVTMLSALDLTGPGLPPGFRAAARLMKLVPGMARAAAFYRLEF
ncbi:class I SAM-dependent methyltransferase [Nonomuraea sp. LPB2021202275-12-8]|uniref:class I SAM-dependent methyltransferase n=1 Tax=Nonomuraea sp. LPB2021202275-12-8 TaxID=3120159 RepID=UPI00300C6814